MAMTTGDSSLYAHETAEDRERMVYDLHCGGRPLSELADIFEANEAQVRAWIEAYKARTDTQAADEQPGLFDI